MTKNKQIKGIVSTEFSLPHEELTWERNRELARLNAKKQKLHENGMLIKQFDKAGNFKPPTNEADQILQDQFKTVKENISTIWVNYYLYTGLLMDNASQILEKQFDTTNKLHFLSHETIKLCALSFFDKTHKEYFNKATSLSRLTNNH